MSGAEPRWRIVKGGNGRPLEAGDHVVVHYVCALSAADLDVGDVIDNSDWLTHALEVTVGGGDLLPGLESVIRHAALGDTVRVEVPPELAFGERGIPGRIPPNATLYFDVELSTSLPAQTAQR